MLPPYTKLTSATAGDKKTINQITLWSLYMNTFYTWLKCIHHIKINNLRWQKNCIWLKSGMIWFYQSSQILAAHRYGIKRVILPERNLKDLVEVPPSVLANLEVNSVAPLLNFVVVVNWAYSVLDTRLDIYLANWYQNIYHYFLSRLHDRMFWKTLWTMSLLIFMFYIYHP